VYLVIEKSFRDVALSRNGPGRDAGHFVPFRDCLGQSGTSGHPKTDRDAHIQTNRGTWF